MATDSSFSSPTFYQILTRDFQPIKPDPATILHICEKWSVEPAQVAVVGDYKTDMICGKRAGAGGRWLAS